MQLMKRVTQWNQNKLSEPEAQKSDVCNEINKSGAVEQPEKLCAADEKSDAMEPKQTE